MLLYMWNVTSIHCRNIMKNNCDKFVINVNTTLLSELITAAAAAAAAAVMMMMMMTIMMMTATHQLPSCVLQQRWSRNTAGQSRTSLVWCHCTGPWRACEEPDSASPQVLTHRHTDIDTHRQTVPWRACEEPDSASPQVLTHRHTDRQSQPTDSYYETHQQCRPSTIHNIWASMKLTKYHYSLQSKPSHCTACQHM